MKHSTLRTIQKTVKKTGRKLTARFLTAAAISAVVPYSIKKEINPKTGDRGIVLNSLILKTEISPKCEDSEQNKTLVSIGIRPMKEVRADLRRMEELCRQVRNPVKQEPPVPLTAEEEKALKKVRAKAKKIEKKIEKKRMKKAEKEAGKRMAHSEASK